VRNRYRIHLLGLSHLPCSDKYNACAFTMKNFKLSKMLTDIGHEVIFYGAEGSTVTCSTFIQTHTLKDIRADYGDGDNRYEVGYDTTKGDYRQDFGLEPKKPSTLKFTSSAVKAINDGKKDDDFLLMSMGCYHKPVHDATKLFLTCEPGIGYRGSYCRFRAFESHYMRSYMQGVETQNRCVDGHNYDRVIPNYFDRKDFEFSDLKKDYVLYIGRLIWRKGLAIAYQAAKQAGVKLVICGQGGTVRSDGSFLSTVDSQVVFPAGGWEYYGYASPEDRKNLMMHARAVMCPTIYMEPFAGVHVEAMLCGTPVITSNFGVYGGETFLDGVHGFKCNTLKDYVYAIKNVDSLCYGEIRKWAERFLCENVVWQFQRWFEDMYEVYLSSKSLGKGWGEVPVDVPEWHSQVYNQVGTGA
jgi:glycosyltransferase involved in cell wall biosynthesis